MNTAANNPACSLAMRRGEALVVTQPLGQMVLCTEGTLWVTHDAVPASGDAGGACMTVRAVSDAKVWVMPLGPLGPLVPVAAS